MFKKIGKSVLLNSLWYTLGRGNLVRLARFLTNEVRLDVGNDPSTNGEIMVQSCLLVNYRHQENLCVLDVGANVGDWTCSFISLSARYHRKLFVHAFEPCQETCATLVDNLRRQGLEHQVQLNNMALSSSISRRPFYSIGANAGINGLYPIMESGHGQTVQEIETDTIDHYCAQNDISHIDFIKVDTEGHDLDVLYGCKGLLAAKGIDMVQFEYNARWIDSRHYLRDAFDFFLPFGYVIGKVTPKGIEFYSKWDYELESFRETNYLALKPVDKDLFPQIKWWNA